MLIVLPMYFDFIALCMGIKFHDCVYFNQRDIPNLMEGHMTDIGRIGKIHIRDNMRNLHTTITLMKNQQFSKKQALKQKGQKEIRRKKQVSLYTSSEFHH